MLVNPCSASEAGKTLRTLGMAHIANVGCIEKWEIRMESIRVWNEEQDKLYNNNIKGK